MFVGMCWNRSCSWLIWLFVLCWCCSFGWILMVCSVVMWWWMLLLVMRWLIGMSNGWFVVCMW